MIVTIVIILAIIGVVVYFLVTGGIKDVDENINLEELMLENEQDKTRLKGMSEKIQHKEKGEKETSIGFLGMVMPTGYVCCTKCQIMHANNKEKHENGKWCENTKLY